MLVESMAKLEFRTFCDGIEKTYKLKVNTYNARKSIFGSGRHACHSRLPTSTCSIGIQVMQRDINYFCEVRNNLLPICNWWGGGAPGRATDVRFPASRYFLFIIVCTLLGPTLPDIQRIPGVLRIKRLGRAAEYSPPYSFIQLRGVALC
jgi:hypothetical protein